MIPTGLIIGAATAANRRRRQQGNPPTTAGVQQGQGGTVEPGIDEPPIPRITTWPTMSDGTQGSPTERKLYDAIAVAFACGIVALLAVVVFASVKFLVF